LAVLAVLVLAHEAGHFWIARRNGVIAEEFGFGFPPRLVGFFKDKEGKRRWIFGNKEIEKEIKNREETIYSINLIPLGGFVKIYGEEGEGKNDPRSFSSKGVFTRFRIIAAGVAMNVILAMVLFAAAFYLGLPQVVDEKSEENLVGQIQILEVKRGSVAEEVGLKMGDQILFLSAQGEKQEPKMIKDVQDFIKRKAGQEIEMKVKSPADNEPRELKVRVPENDPEGDGLLGIAMGKTVVKKYGFLQSLWLGVVSTISFIGMIIFFLVDLLVKLIKTEPVSVDLAGPVGIAILTKQTAQLGLAYLFQFAAFLSVNLAVINFLPFPALDGGRALFLVIEKIKGRPVSKSFENAVHTIGFALLLVLMIFVTIRDFVNFEIVEKIKNIF